MNYNSNIGIILLAAGSSSRLGQNKLILKIENETLLERTLRAAINSLVSEVVLVFGANCEENEKIAGQFPVKIVVNKNWLKGIGSSIKCGLKKVMTENPNLDAAIISVCDQPFLSSELLNRIIEKYQETEKQIIASAYAGSIGVPVLYDKSMFGELLVIPDENGAKKHILEKVNQNILSTVSFPKGEIDIDTLDDMKKLYSSG